MSIKKVFLSDQIEQFVGIYAWKGFPDKLRKINNIDEETRKTFVFLTNNFALKVPEIALLYTYRCKVELFFKLINST